MDVRVQGVPMQPPAAAGPAPAPAAAADRRLQLQQAATSFEALFLAHLVKSMHSQESLCGETADASAGDSVLRELADEQLAQALASRGGIGLGAMLAESLAARLGPAAPEAPAAAGAAADKQEVDRP